MSNTWDDRLAADLRERGWTIVPAPEDSHYSPWYAYRTPSAECAKCAHSDSSPRLILSKWSITATNAATMSLRGSSGGVWYEVSASALEIETLVDKIDAVSIKLTDGWTALSKSSIPRGGDSPQHQPELSDDARDALVWLSCSPQNNLTCKEARLKIAEFFGSSVAEELKGFFS